MLRLVSLFALLAHATAYYRAAMDVTGAVVAGAGNLTAGGKIGTYTVLLQVLNPGLGDLKLLLECCGNARGYASEIASKVNLNMIAGDQEEIIRKDYVGDGKCSAPGPIESLAKKGNTQCNYVYSFANKAWKQYEYTAQCVPSDVCSVDVVGATKGLKVAYPVVIQVLNRNAGDLFYAGQGPIGSCLEGMNSVNLANTAAKKEETSIEIFGKKIPTGFKETMHIEGMTQLKVPDMFSKCDETSDKGILYVFKNKFWINPQHAMNITDFDLQQEMAQRKKDLDELMNYKLPEKGEKPAEPKEEPKGFDIAAALGKLGGKVESTLEKETSVKAADIQNDLDEAEDEIEEDKEEAEEKIEEEQEELKEWKAEKKEEKKEAEEEEEEDEEPYGYVPEAQKAVIHHKVTEEDDEPYGYVPQAPEPPKAPEVPKVPELPKVEAPEPPKAPEVPKVPELPKVEAPEPPKAPEVPKVPELPKVEAPEPPKAPEVPKVPELPKVEAPEPPKAPEVPKVPEVEAPEAPKAPEVPEVPKVEAPEPPKAPEAPEAPEVPTMDTVQEKAKKAAEDLAKKLAEKQDKTEESSEEKTEEKPAPKEVTARRLEAEHIMI